MSPLNTDARWQVGVSGHSGDLRARHEGGQKFWLQLSALLRVFPVRCDYLLHSHSCRLLRSHWWTALPIFSTKAPAPVMTTTASRPRLPYMDSSSGGADFIDQRLVLVLYCTFTSPHLIAKAESLIASKPALLLSAIDDHPSLPRQLCPPTPELH